MQSGSVVDGNMGPGRTVESDSVHPAEVPLFAARTAHRDFGLER